MEILIEKFSTNEEMNVPLLKRPIYDLTQMRDLCRLMIDITGRWELLLPFGKVWLHLEIADPHIKVQIPQPWHDDWDRPEIVEFVDYLIFIIHQRSRKWWRCWPGIRNRYKHIHLALDALEEVKHYLRKP